MVNFLISVFFFFIGLILGGYLLLYGRKGLAITTAIICLMAVGGALALIYYDESNAWDLTQDRSWLLLGIAVAVGIVGGILGSRAKPIAAAVIGFAAGATIGLWLYDIATYIAVGLADLPQQTTRWIGLGLIIIGGILGYLLTRRNEGVAIILVSVFVGTSLIVYSLGLSSNSSFTAVVALSLALLGLVVQYAQYLREQRSDRHYFVSETSERPAPELFDLSDSR